MKKKKTKENEQLWFCYSLSSEQSTPLGVEAARGIISPFILLGVNGSLETPVPFILTGLLGISCSSSTWGTFSFCSLSMAGFVLGDDSVRDLLFGRTAESALLDLCSINEADSDLCGDAAWGVSSWRDFTPVRFGDFLGEGAGSLSESLCLEDFWPVSNKSS